ncbi:MAG: phospholipid-binding protein MlaC [Pseudohongiellaceae bacterium]
MKLLKKLVLVVGLGMILPLQAQDRTAVETAEIGVNTLLETVAEARQYFMSDRDRYFREIEQVLDTFVDFNAVAEVVMSRYASQATAAQKERFANILKSTLTRFYGASLVSYEGQELIFLPARNPDADPRADKIVGMELRGDQTLRLQYQMFLNDNDEWKLKNISLAGINLGRQYYTQFAALMSEHNNDIDAVLNNWQ